MDDYNIFDVTEISTGNSSSSTAKAVVNGDLGNGSIMIPSNRSSQKLMDIEDMDNLPSLDESLDQIPNFDISSLETLNQVNGSLGAGCIPKSTNILSGFSPGHTSTQVPQNPEGNNNIILVEPSSSNDEISKKFLNNDLNIAKGLKNSNFEKAGIESVSKNRSRNILIIKVKKTDVDTVTSLLATTHLGNYEVSCRLPNSKSKSIGVIGPIGLDTPLNDLQGEIMNQNANVEKIERIFKGKEKTPTMSVKVTFTQTDLPKYLYFAYQRFKVSVFIGSPWQCYRCQGFGHNAQHCRYKPRCLVCAGPHQLRECDKRTANNRITNVKCSNCKGDHTANYGGCPFYKDAKEVEKLRVNNKVSYRDAVKLLKDVKGNQNNDSVQGRVSQKSASTVNMGTSSNYSLSNLSQISKTQSKVHFINKTATISTQTDFAVCESDAQTESAANKADKVEIIKGIASIFANLFENKSSNKPVTKDDIIEIFNKTFQTNIIRSDLNQAKEVQAPAIISEPQVKEVQIPAIIPETQDLQNDSDTDWSQVISPKSRKRKNLNRSPDSKGQISVGYLTQLGAASRSNRFKKKK